MGTSEGEVRTRRLPRQAAQSIGNPSEIGCHCRFLCSENAGSPIGQKLIVDTGACLYAI